MKINIKESPVIFQAYVDDGSIENVDKSLFVLHQNPLSRVILIREEE